MTELSLLTGLLDPARAGDRIYGVVVGVVTNNVDRAGLGRVKVAFPWLSDNNESYWARVVTPMAGKGRGLYLLPEIDDEVLVAFEHGRIDFPYVLGALWNGKDAPPEVNDDDSKKNARRVLKSRSGHVIRLDDTDGKEKVEIIDKANNQITIHSDDKSITIVADGDVTIQSKNGKVKINGQGVEINAQANVSVSAKQNLNLEATGQTTVKGQPINLN
jgi:uncharacterized protein involved in type VI secretion and phage assembly